MNRGLALALVVTLGGAGCASSNPCDGKDGACIDVHVEGTAPGLDQLRVSVDVPTMASKNTPPVPRALELPFDFALLLPAGTTGTVNVAVDGLAAGVTAWHDAEVVRLVDGRGKVTIAFGDANADASAGGDLQGADLFNPACVGVAACVDGDGCCPSSCDNDSDKDCPAVCGNNKVEVGEVCDDGNLLNGDACDPTCQFRNAVTTISGRAGSTGFADAPPRFAQPLSIAFDGVQTFYVADRSTYVVRKIDGVQGTTTTYGKAYNAQQTDGAADVARFSAPQSVAFVGGLVYVLDTQPTNKVRTISAAGAVTSVASLANVAQSLRASADFSKLLYVGLDGSLNRWTPATQTTETLATAAQISAAVPGISCGYVAEYAGAFYLSCGTRILRVTNAGALPTIVSFAGSAQGCTPANTVALGAAQFTILGELNVGANGLVFTDWYCNTLWRVNGSNVDLLGGAAAQAGYTNAFSSDYTLARFYQPRAVVPTSIGGTTYYVLDTANDAIRKLGLYSETFVGSPKSIVETIATTKANASYGIPIAGLAVDGGKIYALDSNGKLFTVDIASGDASAALFDFGKGAQAMVRMGNALYAALNDGTIHSIGLDGSGDTVYAGTAGTTNPPTEGVGPGAILDARALATDGTDLYFFDGGKLVRKIDHSTKQTSRIQGTVGSSDLVDAQNATVDAHFGQANGDLVYAAGALYRMDADTSMQGASTGLQLRKIDLATKAVTTIAGKNLGPGTADGIKTAAEFAGAYNLTSDGISLFAFDSGNQSNGVDRSSALSSTIRQIELSTVNVTTMVGTRGHWTTFDETGTKARVNGGGPMVFDPVTHAIYFVDNAEGVFRKIK